MIKKRISQLLAFLLLLSLAPSALAVGTYTDTRFQGKYTTENLDAIIEEYQLYDGWYWTTEADVDQTYHGQEDKPGWTDTAANNLLKTDYLKGWYGCRWYWDQVSAKNPNQEGWGECYGFCQFIGYLLSGKRNPQGSKGWLYYEDLYRSKGLKVGDIVRIDYYKKGYHYQHGAVVYKVDGDTVTFLQVSGGNYNQLNIDCGFMGGGLDGTTSVSSFTKRLKGFRVWRAPDNK